jgi:hypothetical protein
MNKSKYLRNQKKQTRKKRYKGGTLNSVKRKLDFFARNPLTSLKALAYNGDELRETHNTTSLAQAMRRRAKFFHTYNAKQQQQYIEDTKIVKQFTPEQKAFYEELTHIVVQWDWSILNRLLDKLKKKINTSNKNGVVIQDSMSLIASLRNDRENHSHLIHLVENPLIVETLRQLLLNSEKSSKTFRQLNNNNQLVKSEESSKTFRQLNNSNQLVKSEESSEPPNYQFVNSERSSKTPNN